MKAIKAAIIGTRAAAMTSSAGGHPHGRVLL